MELKSCDDLLVVIQSVSLSEETHINLRDANSIPVLGKREKSDRPLIVLIRRTSRCLFNPRPRRLRLCRSTS